MRKTSGLATLLLFPAAASAQTWSVVLLSSADNWQSYVYALTATRQGGYEGSGGSFSYGFWRGSRQSWVNLYTAPSGHLLGMDGDSQVGSTAFGAALWHGTSGSRVDLDLYGTAYAVSGNTQVGSTFTSGVSHALLWQGTPASRVDLNPIGALRSGAYAAQGATQGGYADWGDGNHAALWFGTSQSAIDLHPNGLPAGAGSIVYGMANGVQAGNYSVPATPNTLIRAAVWRGTRESWVDLHNPQWESTLFWATTGSVHAGVVGFGFTSHAAVNFGTPDSWIDLHQFLPPQFSRGSSAQAIYQDGNRILVGGYADNAVAGHNHAILWIGILPCYANCDNSTEPPVLNVLDFNCFLNAFNAGTPYANCDGSTTPPILNVLDFNCFLNRFTAAAGCQ
jgi:hypothetical protein